MSREITATLIVFALAAGCDRAPEPQPPSSATADSSRTVEVPAVLLAHVTFEEGHTLDIYKGALNQLLYMEKGKLGTPPYGRQFVGKSDREIWTRLLPDKPLPPTLVAPERSDASEPPVVAQADLAYSWPDEADCDCGNRDPEHPTRACWNNASGNTAYQVNDVLTGHSSVCNWGNVTVRQAASYRTWFSWSTAIVQDLLPGEWGYGWHGNSAPFDFDWSSKVFVPAGLANYAHVVRAMDHNWIAH